MDYHTLRVAEEMAQLVHDPQTLVDMNGDRVFARYSVNGRCDEQHLVVVVEEELSKREVLMARLNIQHVCDEGNTQHVDWEMVNGINAPVQR